MNVDKIFIALEELDLPYKVCPVDVFDGRQFTPEFLKLNPNAKVPVIVDHDGLGGTSYTLFESGAILLYLGDKTSRLLPKSLADRYTVIQWLMVQLTGIGPMFGQYIHFVRYATTGNDYSRTRYATQVHRLFGTLNERLGVESYLGGSDYSIADVAAFPWMRYADFLIGEAKSKYPNVLRWIDKISARPAVVRALKATDELRVLLTPFEKAESDKLDRLVGNGSYAAPRAVDVE